MIVECPRCSARYRVEAEILQDDPTFKCSRCSHIFPYEAEDPVSEAPEPPPTVEEPEPLRRVPTKLSRDDASLSFSFAGGDGEAPVASRQVAAGEPHPAVAGPRIEPDRDGEDFVFGEEEEFEDSPVEEEEAPDPDPQPRFVRGEDELRIEEEPIRRPERPYLVFLVLLILLYGNLALYLTNHPAEAEQALSRIPVAGPSLTEDRLLQTKIYLQEIDGAYQQIKDDRLVFIVSGRAVNTSPQPLKGVQIESVIYDAKGSPLETKNIYCGNAMSLKIVKDLSSKEISLLQRLEPPQRFEIRPGEAAAFTVVFMNPPPDLKEFSAHVVTAQRTIS